MKVFALYNKKNEFIASFPTREGAEDYGVSMFGRENGWEFDIREMWMQTTPQYPLTTPLQLIPCTIPKPIQPIQPPYQWTCGDGPKATFAKEGPLGPTGIPGPTSQVVSHSSPVDSGPFAPGTK